MPVFADFSDRAAPFTTDSARGREWLRNTRTISDQIADAARADSTSADGLKMTVRHDESGRPIREFSNTGSRKLWMDKYRGQPQLQIRISKRADPPGSAQAVAYETEWRATQAMVASGNITLPEI